ncbi:Uncharacterised protein [Mycobacteroides abscessus subsp. abscessus]|nr:Uncharacterised protein [Mycobacteroides abscessus subsp. abscessus]
MVGMMAIPTSAMADEAANTAPGQRTVAVPMRRHQRTFTGRLGSSKPKRPATTTTAGAAVSAPTTTTSSPSADGMPSALK